MRTFVLVAILLTASSCQRDEGVDYAKETNPPKSTTSTVPLSTTDAPPPQMAEVPEGVELKEYTIRMAQTLPAGKHTFAVVNAGKETHSIEFEGNGLETGLPEPLSRGNKTTFEVTLKPGTYEVYCPVDDHQERGMTMKLVVK